MKSAMDPQVWLFIGALLVAMCPVYPLPCIPCSEVACTQPVNCKEGMVASVESCGCCTVCAKVEGEVCGGERQEDGSCDSGLVCVVRNRQAGQALGLCEPAICKAKKCGFRKMCILGNNSQPICKCIPSCTSNKHKPVCGYSNGRQYSNECELYRDECTTGRVIGRMQGPCKKCFHAGKTFRFGETRRGKKACDSCRCFHGEWKCHTNTPCPQDIVKSCTMSRDIHGRTVRPRCPKGYWCKVQIPGIPEADIPGVAVCVPGNPPAVTGSTTETSSLPPVQVTTVNRDEKIPSQCLLDVDEGPCRAAFNRWYYDKAKGKCVAFFYGGCDGNANNFYTKPACKNLCVQRNKTAVHTPPPHMANVITQEPLLTMGREFCRLPAVTGPCRASFPRWYYNWSRRKCLKFTYGGCKGNVNNFRTKEDCKRRCMRRKVSSLTSTSVSSSPPSTTAPVNSAEMFYCRCTYCVGQDRCSTSVGCFSSINYSVDGGVVGPPTKGCFNALQYQLQCTVTGSQTLVECCKEDMCNDFTISEDNSKQRQAEIATPSPKTEPAVVTCHDSPSDTFYGEGESWEPNDCTVCVCRSGTPECLATVCRHPDCREPLYIKGQCCPVCPLVSNSSDHNELELIKAFAENKLDTVLVSINHGHHKDVCRDIRSGQVYLVGQSWQLDQCTTCYCGKSGKAACAVQMCERDPQCKNLFHEPNHCCPMCKDEHVVKSTSQCYDTITQKYYQKAELWQRDECTSCYCGSDRKPHCTDTICPPVECDAPLKIEKRCCPVCPDTIQQGCMYDGQKFLHGDLKLLSDQCTLCKCENGDWHCSNDSCLISQVQQDGRQN